MTLDHLTSPIVQLSLDLTSLDEALETAAIGVAAGVDWLLEASEGLPLVIGEETYVEQLVRNLLTKAAKYSDPAASGRHFRRIEPRNRAEGRQEGRADGRGTCR